MSYDFIEDAADILERQKAPWLIIMGTPSGTITQCHLSNENNDNHNVERMIDQLRIIADQLENGEMKGWTDNEKKL